MPCFTHDRHHDRRTLGKHDTLFGDHPVATGLSECILTSAGFNPETCAGKLVEQ